MSILITVLAVVLLAVAAIAMLLRNILRQTNEPLPDAAWLENFNVSRYRPMQRLLSDDDYTFLAANGGSREVIARLRAERRRVFRAYLKNMVRDFNRFHRAARVVAVQMADDSSNLMFELIKLRVTFSWTVTVVEFRLCLHTLGLGSVDARRLIASLDRMSAGYTAMVPAGHMASA